MFSFPASLVFGIVGLISDRHRLLALVSTLISGGLMVFWAYMVGR